MQNVRFNALRHGLRAKILILPDEDPAAFNSLLQDLETEWRPQTPTEFIQVERMAVNYWKLARADRREAFFRLNEMPDRFLDQSFKFQQGFERAFDRAQCALERMQVNRLPVESSEPPAETAETIASVLPSIEAAAPSPTTEPPIEVAAIQTAETPTEISETTETAATLANATTAGAGVEPSAEAVVTLFSREPTAAATTAAEPGPPLLTPVSLELCNSRKPSSPPASI